jgi:hypothetical protein
MNVHVTPETPKVAEPESSTLPLAEARKAVAEKHGARSMSGAPSSPTSACPSARWRSTPRPMSRR